MKQPGAPPGQPELLSERELQVLKEIAKGRNAAEAGVILNVSKRAIDQHLQRIYQKLRVKSMQAQALQIARELGYDLPPPQDQKS